MLRNFCTMTDIDRSFAYFFLFLIISFSIAAIGIRIKIAAVLGDHINHFYHHTDHVGDVHDMRDDHERRYMRGLLAQVCVAIFINAIWSVMGVVGVVRRNWFLLAFYGCAQVAIGGWLLGILRGRFPEAAGSLEIVAGGLGIFYAVFVAATKKKPNASATYSDE